MLDLLEREHVLVHPGFFFDFPHEAFVVVSLLPHPGYFCDAFPRDAPHLQLLTARMRGTRDRRYSSATVLTCTSLARTSRVAASASKAAMTRPQPGPPPRGPAHPAVLLPSSRRAGASATSATSRRLAAWLASAGVSASLQLLPINEMAPGQQSPYSAISAMAIDPIFISAARASPNSPRSAAKPR